MRTHWMSYDSRPVQLVRHTGRLVEFLGQKEFLGHLWIAVKKVRAFLTSRVSLDAGCRHRCMVWHVGGHMTYGLCRPGQPPGVCHLR